MKLPGLQLAQVSHHKLKNYLLDNNQPAGGPKANFFIANGFSPSNPGKLKQALLLHAKQRPVAGVKDFAYGMKYIIEGELLTPNGQSPKVVTVWQINQGQNVPRLVTAYPAKVRQHD